MIDEPPGHTLRLVGGGEVRLAARFATSQRLWVATLDLDVPVLTYLAVHGRPIRYGYVTRDWPLDVYQNVYAREPGSAEMPSAGRPFTPELVTELVARGLAEAVQLGQMLRNPTYTGIGPRFWASMDMVGGPDEWVFWGTANCGKGQPIQVGHTGHPSVPARFTNVRVGVR